MQCHVQPVVCAASGNNGLHHGQVQGTTAHGQRHRLQGAGAAVYVGSQATQVIAIAGATHTGIQQQRAIAAVHFQAVAPGVTQRLQHLLGQPSQVRGLTRPRLVGSLRVTRSRQLSQREILREHLIHHFFIHTIYIKLVYQQVKERLSYQVFCLIDDAKVSTKKHPAKKSFTRWELWRVLGRVSAV